MTVGAGAQSNHDLVCPGMLFTFDFELIKSRRGEVLSDRFPFAAIGNNPPGRI
jgi:hypothetical protein